MLVSSLSSHTLTIHSEAIPRHLGQSALEPVRLCACPAMKA